LRKNVLKLDSHQHFWHYNPAAYGWINDRMTCLQRDFLPLDLRNEAKAVGIDGAISVQAIQTLPETEWLLELAAQDDFIKGVVGWAPLIDSNVDQVLAALASNPKLVGIRHVLQDEPDPFYMLREDFNRGIRHLRPLGLPYDVLIFERHLPQTIEFVDRHEGQVFIVDHLAKPRVKDGLLSPWQDNIRELAKRPNLYCKLSGLVTEADHREWTRDQLQPYMETVLDAFGPARVMFGSDWPVCLLAVPYAEWVDIVTNAVGTLSAAEQERIWSGTAIEAYRLFR
jgi:L-fuconolactonase